MGDHRVSIKATFEMHGVKEKLDWWLNWSDEIPQRVSDWVEQQKEKAMQKLLAEDAEYQEQKAREQRAADEANERAEYERLKAKFGQPTAQS